MHPFPRSPAREGWRKDRKKGLLGREPWGAQGLEVLGRKDRPFEIEGSFTQKGMQLAKEYIALRW